MPFYCYFSNLNVFCDSGLESCYILNTYELLYGLTIFEYDDSRYTHDTKLAWSIRISIDVMLHDFCFSFDFSCELFETRKHDLAWTTPLSPEVDESDSSCDIRSEISISRNYDRED